MREANKCLRGKPVIEVQAQVRLDTGGSAERLGGDEIAGKIRKLSSRGDLLQSIDRALAAGMRRFIAEYTTQDEDLVSAIQEDELLLQSEVVQDALVKLVSRPGAWLREEWYHHPVPVIGSQN